MVKGDIKRIELFFSDDYRITHFHMCVRNISVGKNNFQVAISFSLFHFLGYNWNPLQLLCHKDSLIDEAVIIKKENVKYSIKKIGG